MLKVVTDFWAFCCVEKILTCGPNGQPVVVWPDASLLSPMALSPAPHFLLY